ncbi:MAG: transporter [Anaerolineaceae bacterium]|jgi:Co/Zn/Cd efflux system component|nr:MAG: transporter [Anaerolineaceae bacterium]CAG0986048.1 Cadmium, cobalt and zinc/H(+)-K(+) antiporter [Anaerolineales bacterium]
MDKSLFEITQMDCAAEENLVRMKLDDVKAIRRLDFDLSVRRLTIYHEGKLDTIEKTIHELNLNTRLLKTEITDEIDVDDSSVQKSLLWTVLLINFSFFVIEALFGFISGSMGLVADSLDMLADAIVYGLSLIAVGAAFARKKTVAKMSGYFQLFLALIGFLEVVRRFIGLEILPDFRTMISVSVLALIANSVCLYLLQRSKNQEVHIKATMIFTSNDVIINLGVITAGLLVNWLNSGIPDLIIGAIVFIIVTRGAFKILSLAK